MSFFKPLFFVFSLLLLSFQPSGAQVPAMLVSEDSLLDRYFEDVYTMQLYSIPELPKQQKTYVQERFKDRRDEQKNLLESSDLLYYSDLQRMLEQVLNEIVEKNNLSKEYRIFLTGELYVNAYTSGDGNIFITIGLLERMKHLDELKFVICHELSHQLQNHVNQSIYDMAAWTTDERMQRDVAKMRRLDYEKRKQLEGYIMSKIADSRKHSREAEYEADAIGLSLLTEVGGNKDLAFSLLERLDMSEYELYSEKLDLDGFLASIGVPFQSNWRPKPIVSSLGFDAYDKYVVAEEFKTHPDIPLRINALEGDTTMRFSERYPVVHKEYKSFQEYAEKESIRFWLLNGNTGRAFFRAMLHRQQRNDAFSNEMILLTLSQLAHARKFKKYGYHVSMENIMWDDNYNECLYFLNALNSEDLLLISLNFKKYTQLEKSEYTSVSDILLNMVSGDVNRAAFLKDQYLKDYPNGIFNHYLNQLITSEKK